MYVLNKDDLQKLHEAEQGGDQALLESFSGVIPANEELSYLIQQNSIVGFGTATEKQTREYMQLLKRFLLKYDSAESRVYSLN